MTANEKTSHVYSIDQAFQIYVNKAEQKDHTFLTECNAAMDSLLVFAGLFSAITTAFIVESSKELKPNPEDQTQRLLEAILQRMADPFAPSTEILHPSFTTPTLVVLSNTLYYMSLCVSLLAALGAILIKQWARNSCVELHRSILVRRRARLHHQRLNGRDSWGFNRIVAWIPMLLHLSLLLFLIGLLVWLWRLDIAAFATVFVIVGVAIAVYLACATIPAFDPRAPFIWPMSNLVSGVLRQLPQPTTTTARNDWGLMHTVLPILATPIKRIEPPSQEVAFEAADSLDVDIMEQLLQDATTALDIEAILYSMARLLQTRKYCLDALPCPVFELSVQQGAKLVSSCGVNHDGQLSIPSPAHFRMLTTSIQFFEVVLQLVPSNHKRCNEALVSVGTASQLLLRKSKKLKAVNEIALAASCLYRIEVYRGDREAMIALIKSGLDHMKTLVDLGPNPPGSSTHSLKDLKKWTRKDINEYQAMVSAYLSSYIALVTACDDKPLGIEKKSWEDIKFNSKQLLENSRHWQSQVEDYPLLLKELRHRQQQGSRSDNRQSTTLIIHLMKHLGV